MNHRVRSAEVKAAADRVARFGVHSGYVGSLTPAWLRFLLACRDPRRAQEERLRRLLVANAESAYGRAHGFAAIRTFGEFQDRVPIADYDALEPWVRRAACGERGVLTREPVRLFELSGGSSAPNKLIPYTNGLLAEFSAATHAWLCNLHMSHPRLIGTQAYWSISPVARERKSTEGGLPIGIEDDTEYFGPLGRWALGKLMAVPPGLAHLSDMREWRVRTLAHLLECRTLGLISVWHPSFLTLLLDFLDGNLDEVLARVSPDRQAEIRAADGLRDVWPRLGLISCWTDGPAHAHLSRIEAAFPGVPVQGKGLLATEGVVTIPVAGAAAPVAALSAHVLEFIDLESPRRRPLLAHELRRNGHYSPLLSTAGGFYRYHLKDEVECVGFWHGAPCLRFLGKLDATSDLRGEKITPAQVDAALARIGPELGMEWKFALLAPVKADPPYYRLFVETAVPARKLRALAEALEHELAQGHHYAYCRKLGQLEGMQVQRVKNGMARWQAALTERGHRAGDLKFVSVDGRCDWDAVFSSTGDGEKA